MFIMIFATLASIIKHDDSCDVMSWDEEIA